MTKTSAQQAFAALFDAMADLFAAEVRPGGDQAATALRLAAGSPPDAPSKDSVYLQALSPILTNTHHPITPLIATAAPFIDWGPSDLGEGRIPDDLASAMPMCELIGPDGLVPNTDIRVGLWMQSPATTYGPRRHIAEETFLIFAGEAEWHQENKPPRTKGAGEVVHHPSNVLHTSITRKHPVLAAWRWSGDIGFEGYKLSG